VLFEEFAIFIERLKTEKPEITKKAADSKDKTEKLPGEFFKGIMDGSHTKPATKAEAPKRTGGLAGLLKGSKGKGKKEE
jgi:hypothetical protein